MTWLQPAAWSIFATSFAEMGARLLSFLSWRAYGKLGMTAVIRRADAVLHAFTMINSSIKPSFTSPGVVRWTMKTSSSRILSWIAMHVSWLELRDTLTRVSSKPRLSCLSVSYQEECPSVSYQEEAQKNCRARNIPVSNTLGKIPV